MICTKDVPISSCHSRRILIIFSLHPRLVSLKEGTLALLGAGEYELWHTALLSRANLY
jgi:hypothetical protein